MIKVIVLPSHPKTVLILDENDRLLAYKLTVSKWVQPGVYESEEEVVEVLMHSLKRGQKTTKPINYRVAYTAAEQILKSDLPMEEKLKQVKNLLRSSRW